MDSMISTHDAAASYLLSEKHVAHPINPHVLAPCPSMELTAVGTKNDQVLCFRRNGQKVFSVSQQNSSKIHQARWNPNGNTLATAWGDGKIRLIAAENGKVVRTIDAGGDAVNSFTCLSWRTTSVYPERARKKQKRELEAEETGDIDRAKPAHQPSFAELPKALLDLQAESSLLKLSTLPPGHGDEDIFSTRTAMDALFCGSEDPETDNCDVLLAARTDGRVHISVSDGFEIGAFELPTRRDEVGESCVIRISNSSATSRHFVLAIDRRHGTSLTPLNLCFLRASGDHLGLVASRSTQIQNLVTYILQTTDLIMLDWRSSQDLPRKFIRNIDQTLSEQCQCSLVEAAYHLLITGNCYPPMKEWLVDELGERGQKRWDKAVTSGYDGVRKLVYDKLIPALDRTAVLLSRLRGLARHPEVNHTLGLPIKILDDALVGIDCLRILGHRVITKLGLETQQFAAFSEWLKYELSVQAGTADKNSVKDPRIEYRRVLDYVVGPLSRSSVADIFASHTPDDKRGKHDLSDTDGQELYRLFLDEAMVDQDDRQQTMFQPPGLQDLVLYLRSKLQQLFIGVARRQQDNLVFGKSIMLQERSPPSAIWAQVDMRTIEGENPFEPIATFVVLPSIDGGQRQTSSARESSGNLIGASTSTPSFLISIHRLEWRCEERVMDQPRNSDQCSVEPSAEPPTQLSRASIARIMLSDERASRLQSVRFLSDTELVFLISQASQTALLVLPFDEMSEISTSVPQLQFQQCAPEDIFQLYEKSLDSIQPRRSILTLTETLITTLVRAVFLHEEGFVPDVMEIKDGTRIITLLSRDRLGYRVVELG